MNSGIFWGATSLAISLLDLRIPALRTTWYASFAVLWTCISIGQMIDENPGASVLYGAAAAIQAWMWWNRRPPRKRRPSKALGAIRDLGHRLVVAS